MLLQSVTQINAAGVFLIVTNPLKESLIMAEAAKRDKGKFKQKKLY